jgi:hypothetical protein
VWHLKESGEEHYIRLAAAGFTPLTSTKYQEKTQEAFLAEANIYKTKSINLHVCSPLQF